MSTELLISLDGMGGDNAPRSVVRGAALVRKETPNVKFIIYGDKAALKPLVSRQPALRGGVEIRHTDQMVTNDDRPSKALRAGRRSSMRLAIDAVRDGEAQAVVSAGNTGALMGMAMASLRTLPGILRPAITTTMPTLRRPVCMLDLGANVECSAIHLVQFALLGEAFARCVLELEDPGVALLNIGVEETKGRQEVRDAARILRGLDIPFDFKGFIEGDEIAKGLIDVIVTDGYTGNIVLKTIEGSALFLRALLTDALSSSLWAKFGYLFAAAAIRAMRRRVDPRPHNGAVLLGLNGIVVKSHGGADEVGFSYAIRAALRLIQNDFISKIRDTIKTVDISCQGEALE